MRIFVFYFLIMAGLMAGCTARSGDGPEPAGVTGKIVRHANFSSRLVAARHVDVWLPPDYAAGPDRRFPVLYMHDGQNLFDPATSYIKVDWGVDEMMTRLIAQKRVRPAIVVGIWNTPRRVAEYFPRRVADEALPAEAREQLIQEHGTLLGDAYLQFLVTELKPFIDQSYRTLPGPGDTVIMGSSMGGLISLYAFLEYPGVFGRAGCLSTHWPALQKAGTDFSGRRLPPPAGRKIYFDFGTETLDASYEPYQTAFDRWMIEAGYTEGKDWITRKFPGDEHSERAWRKRLDIPLVFLLGN